MSPQKQQQALSKRPEPGNLAVTHHARRVASGGRIRGLLVLFTIALMASLTGMMLLMVSNIFDRLTPSIRNDLEWKVQRGALELSQTMDIAIAAGDERLLQEAASDYVGSADVVGLFVI